jgi:hypothetical protein
MSEIAYALNPQATLTHNCLVLDLLEAIKNEWCTPKEAPSVAYWRALAKQPTDQEALTFLIKEELAFQQRLTGKTPSLDTLRVKQVHVSPSHVSAAFKLLALAQNLYCNGKQLVVDLFGQAEFYYEAYPLSPERLEVKGYLRWRDTLVTLNECEALIPGKPHWFVRGFTLKAIKTEISWKQLQEARQSLLLEGRAKQTFLDNLDPEDSDTPQLIVKEGSLAEIQQPLMPYPLLVLKDRWGACADLWMNYGQGLTIACHAPQAVIKDEKGHFLKRQFDAEANWEKDLLETDFMKKTVEHSHYYCPLDRVAKSLTFLLEVGWTIHDWQGKRVIQQTHLALQLEENPQILTVRGKVCYESHEADVTQVLGAFNRREHFVQLSADTVGLLPIGQTRQALQDLSEESECIAQEVRLKKNRLGALDALWDQLTVPASLTKLKEKWHNFTGIQEAPPSSAFQGQLRPYQQQGVNWLSFLEDYGFHGILADEMGLGKTVQVLAFLSRLPTDRPHLIVLPTSLLFNWRNEIQQFLPSFSFIVHQGLKRATTAQELQSTHIILTSYTTLRLDLPLLQSLSYCCVILDEAQNIKNAHTQTAQAVCRLTAQLRLCLTGTPIENRLQEIWSHFRFLIPDLFGSQESFEADIQAAQADRRYLERIKKKVAPFLLKRRKQEVAADLPERTDQIVWIEMHEEQRRFYDHVLAGFKSGLLKKVELEGVKKHRLEILEAILRLRQVCCHPLLLSSLVE